MSTQIDKRQIKSIDVSQVENLDKHYVKKEDLKNYKVENGKKLEFYDDFNIKKGSIQQTENGLCLDGEGDIVVKKGNDLKFESAKAVIGNLNCIDGELEIGIEGNVVNLNVDNVKYIINAEDLVGDINPVLIKQNENLNLVSLEEKKNWSNKSNIARTFESIDKESDVVFKYDDTHSCNCNLSLEILNELIEDSKNEKPLQSILPPKPPVITDKPEKEEHNCDCGCNCDCNKPENKPSEDSNHEQTKDDCCKEKPSTKKDVCNTNDIKTEKPKTDKIPLSGLNALKKFLDS